MRGILDSLDPCVQMYVLTLETLAELRLSVRSDVVRTWKISEVSFSGYHYQAMIVVRGCGFKASKQEKYLWRHQDQCCDQSD